MKMALEGCRSYHSPCRNLSPDAVNPIGEDEATRSAQGPPPIDGSGSSLAAPTLVATHALTSATGKYG